MSQHCRSSHVTALRRLKRRPVRTLVPRCHHSLKLERTQPSSSVSCRLLAPRATGHTHTGNVDCALGVPRVLWARPSPGATSTSLHSGSAMWHPGPGPWVLICSRDEKPCVSDPRRDFSLSTPAWLVNRVDGSDLRKRGIWDISNLPSSPNPSPILKYTARFPYRHETIHFSKVF